MKHLAWLLVLPAAYLALVANAVHLLILALAAVVVLLGAWIGAGKLDDLETYLEKQDAEKRG